MNNVELIKNCITAVFKSWIFVTGCCRSLRDFEELEMQSCISGSVLLVRIAH